MYPVERMIIFNEQVSHLILRVILIRYQNLTFLLIYIMQSPLLRATLPSFHPPTNHTFSLHPFIFRYLAHPAFLESSFQYTFVHHSIQMFLSHVSCRFRNFRYNFVSFKALFFHSRAFYFIAIALHKLSHLAICRYQILLLYYL